MKKLSAHFVFSPQSGLLKNGILVLDDHFVVSEIIDTGGKISEMGRLEFHNGILITGVRGLTINDLIERQNRTPDTDLRTLLQSFSEKENRTDDKAGIWLISRLDLKNLHLTKESKLKKLV